MKIELSLENVERILAALETEKIKFKEEIKAIDDFITGTGEIMDSRDSYQDLLQVEVDALDEMSEYLGEINDANKDTEETE